MNVYFGGIVILSLSYLLGSVPTGYILCRVFRSIDIREHGSKSIGATNVGRVAGKRLWIATLVLDILKGFIAVALLPVIINENVTMAKVICTIGVVAGHNWTIFLRFQGGKGIATTAGALIGFAPLVFLSSLLVWGLVFTLSRFISLASIVSAVFLPVFMFLYGEPITIQMLGVVVAVLAIVRHKDNIKRLLKGQESKFAFAKR